MAATPASMDDDIIVLDDDDNESTPPLAAASTPSSKPKAEHVTPLNTQEPAPAHSTPSHSTLSPFASAKKQSHVLQVENEKLFTEFVEHCSPLTQECPEVLNFLKTKHSKAPPAYLSSVEFRNTLGRCLTRAKANRSKTFVYINELCTVLRQHTTKKRLSLRKEEPGSPASTSFQSTSETPKGKDNSTGRAETEGAGKHAAEDEQPSTSRLQGDKVEEPEADKKAKKASKHQIAYLENLLKVYNEEISRLQQSELSLDDMGAEDSLYIQEHKLKRKMMKIYQKLCELKECSRFTGRVIEQKIPYNSSRFPEINKRITRFINKPENQGEPPDYQDILQQVQHANQRHNLNLSKRELTQIALDAFRETGSLLQERRHLDLVYNFGSHLTDNYKPASDPALSNPSLLRKLRSNREVALSRLDEVITKYSSKQDDAAEHQRNKRQQKENNNKSEKGDEDKQVNGVKEEEEEVEEEDEEEDEDDVSSDPDIEEEIQASTQHGKADDDDEEMAEDEGNETAQAGGEADKEDQTEELPDSINDEANRGFSPLSDDSKSPTSLSDVPSPSDSVSQSEVIMPTAAEQQPLSNGTLSGHKESVDSSAGVTAALDNTSKNGENAVDDEEDAVVVSPLAANGESSPAPVTSETPVSYTTNGTSPPPSPMTMRSGKRKREDLIPDIIQTTRNAVTQDSEVNTTLDMEVFICNSPQPTRTHMPSHELVSSTQSTPPPKKNKVNVATQYDPEEVIVLSDSE